MSYEIRLYPRTPGQDWAEVLEADEVDGPGMDLATLNRGVARFRRIEARLLELLTEPVRTWVPEEADGDILGELQTRDSGLRVDLYDTSASVSVPYGGPTDPVHDLLRQAVEIVAAETGYEAYDPQVGSAFDGHLDEAAGQASLSQVSDQDDLWAEDDGADQPASSGSASASDAHEPLEGQIVDAEEQDEPVDPRVERARLIQERRAQLLEERQQPASLRRRGWFNVVFGAFAIAIGVMRQSAGQTDLLTWLFFGIGAFEVFGAWMLFSQARKATANEQASQETPTTDSRSEEPPSTPGDGPDDLTQR